MAYLDDINIAAHADLPWEVLSGKNILITGATGLIGSTVVDILMHHCEHSFDIYALGRNGIRAAHRFSAYKDRKNFHFINSDVTTPLSVDIDFHYIIAAASGANPTVYSTHPVEVMKTNFNGVDNIIRYGIEHQLQKFVYISSGDVYGENNEERITEDFSGYINPLYLRSCYSTAKRATETLCVSYAHQYGINVSIVRPCHTFGPYYTEADTRAFAQFINNILKDEDIVLKSAGTQFRSWCYSVDCALGIIYILLKGENMEAYNIADENANISIKQLATIIAQIGNKQIRFENPDHIEMKGYNTITKSVFDTTKLKSLGWKPSGSLKKNLTNTINECKRNEN